MTKATRCPICLGERKVVNTCIECGKKHCIECGTDKLCIDCFIKNENKNLLISYNNDKYKVGIN